MKEIRKNYHWIIFSVLLIEQIIYGGLLNNLNGVFLIPVCDGLEIKRFIFSVAISLRAIGAIVSTLFSGILKKYISNKRLMTLGMFIVSLSCALMGMSRNIVHLSVGFAVMGLCDGFCHTAAVTRILTSWFYSHQGVVLGTTTAGSGIGGSLVCYILTYVMGKFGWRAGFYTSALLTLLLAVLLQIVLYDRPDNLGLQPFGLGNRTYKSISQDRHWIGLKQEVLVRKPVFYLLLAAIFLITFSVQTGSNMVIPFFSDKSFSTNQTALLQSIVMVVLAFSKLGAGFTCDAVGARKVMMFCVLSIGSGILLMIMSQEMTMAVLAMILLGFGLPVTTVMVPLLSHELFGYRSADSLLGVYLSMVSVSGLASSYIANAIFDETGSYYGALYSAVVALLVAFVLILVVYFFASKMRIRFEKNELSY